MLLLKLMGPENCPDDDSRKTHRILSDVVAVNFHRNPAPMAVVTFKDDETHEFDLDGNVYVMNENGKTVSSFGVAHAPGSFDLGDSHGMVPD